MLCTAELKRVSVHILKHGLSSVVLSRQGGCVKKLEGKGKVKDAKATKQLVALLSAPLEKYKDVVTILKLSNYGKVMEHLDYDTNRVMAVVLIQSILANNTLITAPEKVVLWVDSSSYPCLLLLRYVLMFVVYLVVFSYEYVDLQHVSV